MSDYKLREKNRYVGGVDYIAAGSFGPVISPSILLIHFTASTFASAAREFDRPESKKSIHFLIGRDGKVVQKVPLDRAAWHAGADSRVPAHLRPKGVKYPANQSVNFQSIGIEFANEGPLVRDEGGVYRTWYGKAVPESEVVSVTEFGSVVSYWHRYEEVQLIEGLELSKVLVDGLGLREILGHSDVLDGKRDPGPLFPMRAFRSRLFGRDG